MLEASIAPSRYRIRKTFRSTKMSDAARTFAMRIRDALAVLVLLLVSGVEADAKRIALVIGNAAYRHVAPLVNTTNDSDQIARMLKAAGFEVLHHRDLTLAAFRLAVSDLADRSQNADYALVFFAGHGIEVDGVNYFVPVDAKLASDFDVPDETI